MKNIKKKGINISGRPRLVYAGKTLDPKKQLIDYNIQKESTLSLYFIYIHL